MGALEVAAAPQTHTTNLVTVDGEGNACVLTTSLGLGSGDYLPGLDLHLNSMLGEIDLLVGGPPLAGSRMQSMMAPTLVLDGDGPALAIGSAGGTRLRTALVTAAAGVLDEGLPPQEAVDRPRVHPAPDVVNAEPGADGDGLAALEARRPPRQALARAAPLLRRRQSRRARRARGRSQARRRGAGRAPGTLSGIQPT